jgi:NAD(P)-dependent dehydrogenase (short-subunit alcohol dehydrogenase family)
MFNDYVVLITGAASGIGLETARQFVERGATVVGTDVDENALKEAINNLGCNFIPKICDVSQKEQLVSISNFVEANFPKLDVLVNNAGRSRIGIGPEMMEEEDYFYHYDVIIKGPMLLVKYVVPLLKRAKDPSIINISSGAARVEYSNHFLYSTAKAALEKYTRHLVRDLPGIRANTILPGWIDTPLYTKIGLTNEIKDSMPTYRYAGRYC